MANNPAIAKIRCDGCGDAAEVRQQANGKRLLYTVCETCGCDRRTGDALQALWRENMVPLDAELPEATEPAEAQASTPATPGDEWKPDPESAPESETETESSSGPGSMLGLGLAAVLAVGLAVLGVKYSGGRA
ncbi:hypothetical protein [Ferrimonas balearica]|uniref:hypothetical protein n=1 Tax=Ferrimonas balearica TaxID=44012 RepID=UPI001F175A4E|nr:hypothetical protein [Ferrimonas balearica]MBY6095133.1 hypothetical protein [Ferrimonas balearica]